MWCELGEKKCGVNLRKKVWCKKEARCKLEGGCHLWVTVALRTFNVLTYSVHYFLSLHYCVYVYQKSSKNGSHLNLFNLIKQIRKMRNDCKCSTAISFSITACVVW